jgi:hypothetical protein
MTSTRLLLVECWKRQNLSLSLYEIAHAIMFVSSLTFSNLCRFVSFAYVEVMEQIWFIRRNTRAIHDPYQACDHWSALKQSPVL